MLKLFEALWRRREVPPLNPSLIVPLDYAMGQDGHISMMTEFGLRMALLRHAAFPGAMIAFANSSHCFPGSEEVIAKEKEVFLRNPPDGLRPVSDFINAGGIVNSVTEAWAIRDALKRRNIVPREILVITGRQHSRSALYIWERVFPDTRISLMYFRGSEWQANHVFPSQRSGWVWAKANVLRQAALRIMGLKWVAKQQHKPGH